MSTSNIVIYPVDAYGGVCDGADSKRWIQPKNRTYKNVRSQFVRSTRQVFDDTTFETIDTASVSNDTSNTSPMSGIHIADQRLTSSRLDIQQRTFVVSQTIPFIMGGGEFVGAVEFDTIDQVGANFSTANFPLTAIPTPQSSIYHIQATVTVGAYTGAGVGFLRLFLGRVDNLAETEFPTPDIISSTTLIRPVGQGRMQLQLSGYIYLRYITSGSTSNHSVALFFQRPNDTMPTTIEATTMSISLIASDS